MCEGTVNEPITMTPGVPEDVQTLRQKLINMLEGIQSQGQGATPFTGQLSAPPNPLQTQAAGLMGRLMGNGASQPFEPRTPVSGGGGGNLWDLPLSDLPGGSGAQGGRIDNPFDYPSGYRQLPSGEIPGIGGGLGGDEPKPPYQTDGPPVLAQRQNQGNIQSNPLMNMIMAMRGGQRSAYNPKGY